MSIVTPILSELDVEGVSTVRMLERVPADRHDWRPHEKSMSLGQLAWHVAKIPQIAGRLLVAGELNLVNARPAAAPEKGADVVGEYKRNLAAIREQVAGLDDVAVRQTFTVRRGDEVLQSFPKIVMLRSILLNHSVHHRGQLSVYLRLLDVPVPAMYGTSADEPGA